MDLRRLVAVGAVIVEILLPQQRSTRYRARDTVLDAVDKKRLAQKYHRVRRSVSRITSVALFHLPISGSGRSL